MDIARSIDFDCLNKDVGSPPPVPQKDYPMDRIGPDRHISLYTTNSNSFTAEAPPVYQEDHSINGINTVNSVRVRPKIPKSSSPSKFILKTVAHTLDQPFEFPMKHRRNSSEGRKSLQAPKIEPASTRSNRLQSEYLQHPHRVPHGINVIPYTLWSNQKKVIIRHPTDLRYYRDTRSDTPPYKTMETSWVTYSFNSISAASDFQSTLLSPLQLVKSFPTSRTMRLHPSPFVRAFSPRLQLCGLENLRVFRDANDPNCLVCMIHYSPNFRPSKSEEYIVFKLYPPPRISVRIREDGESCVKIKGLDIRGFPAGEQAKKFKTLQTPVEQLEEEAYGSHSIEKIKIEFESGKEKREFLELTRELQGLSSW
ncbi:MAG: hypothetical protein Q9182_004425 [Xanthomendoza sp. 2 TL-2023]